MSENLKQLVENVPPTVAVRDRLGDALREVRLLRQLLRLAETAERYRSGPAPRAAPQEAAAG